MKLFKAIIFMSLILLVGACSQTPEPLIKEQLQLSSQEDYDYLKETSKAAPLEIDLYQAIAIAIKNNRDLGVFNGREVRTRVITPNSKLRAWVLDVLKSEGYIKDFFII